MYDKKTLLKEVDCLYKMWRDGNLGGEVMPEDANPYFEKGSKENYLYFTLPMALNYQRNSYTLWESANKTYQDEETRFVFDPKICLEKSFEEVQSALTKYKVALQKQKQTKICNYWLYVIWQYTDREYKNIENLTVAPDTHVIKASHRLGLISDKELASNDVQLIVIDRWNELFKDTKYKPIDIHTPLWLWSRNGFKDIK